MKQFKRVMLFLLDSVGIGALPDAEKYGDAGTATIQHTLEGNPGLTLPNMERLGLMQIPGMEKFSTGVTPQGTPENRLPDCLYLCRQRIPDCRP